MSASTTMWVIVNVKSNSGPFMLKKTVKNNAKAINAVKKAGNENVRTEYIATINKRVNFNMKTKGMKVSSRKMWNLKQFQRADGI